MQPLPNNEICINIHTLYIKTYVEFKLKLNKNKIHVFAPFCK